MNVFRMNEIVIWMLILLMPYGLESPRWIIQGWMSKEWMTQGWITQGWISNGWMSKGWKTQRWMYKEWMTNEWKTKGWMTPGWEMRMWQLLGILENLPLRSNNWTYSCSWRRYLTTFLPILHNLSHDHLNHGFLSSSLYSYTGLVCNDISPVAILYTAPPYLTFFSVLH